jgi:hypothetical protein
MLAEPSALASPRRGAEAAGAGVGDAEPLVIYTISAAKSESNLNEEIPSQSNKSSSYHTSRKEKYLLQETARKLLPEHRINSCFWALARGEKDVAVVYSPAAGRANYRRLAVCGSVWACPICSSRITSQRAEEIRSALAELNNQGGGAAFATFTVAHSHEDALPKVLNGFLGALHNLTSWRGYKELRAEYGIIGYIRVLEVTYGRNGWHVHAHLLYLFAVPLSPERLAELEDKLYPLWSRAAGRQGLTMTRRYGLEIKKAYGTVEDYLSKYGHGPRWDIGAELTKGHLKRGRTIAGLKHLTPWELLAAAVAGDVRCGALFAEFVEHFSGKAQLYWSPGLRALLLPEKEDATDQELAAASLPDDNEVGAIPERSWGAIRRAKERTVPLELVESTGGTWELLPAYLVDVERRFPPAPAWERRDLTKLPPEIAKDIAEMHRDQAERHRWRGPLTFDGLSSAPVVPLSLAPF